jgi:hypothetical protein
MVVGGIEVEREVVMQVEMGERESRFGVSSTVSAAWRALSLGLLYVGL